MPGGEKATKIEVDHASATPRLSPSGAAHGTQPAQGAERGAGIAPSGSVPVSCAVFERCKAQAVYQGAAGE